MITYDAMKQAKIEWIKEVRRTKETLMCDGVDMIKVLIHNTMACYNIKEEDLKDV